MDGDAQLSELVRAHRTSAATLFDVFSIEVCFRGEVTRLELPQRELTLGRVQTNDIVLPRGNVSKRHARMVCKDGKCILVDLKSTNGTFVNGRRMSAPRVIHPDDVIHIGDFKLTCEVIDEAALAFEREDTREVEPTELRLLAAVAQRDPASRLVYADWLEEQGDTVRAEFLRIQEMLAEGTAPGDPQAHTQRLRELATTIELAWRYKVARPMIENCLAVEFECPKDWGSLATTQRTDVRYCTACQRKVHYCSTVAAAVDHARRGDCVAVDVVNLRRPRDLDAQRPMRMGAMVPIPRG